MVTIHICTRLQVIEVQLARVLSYLDIQMQISSC